MTISRRVLVITEVKEDGTSFFKEAYEAASRQGEDYATELNAIYGVVADDTLASDWAVYDDGDPNPHRDCAANLNCQHGAVWSTENAVGDTLVTYFKCSEADPIVYTTDHALLVERLAHNTEHSVTVTSKLYPADEHFTIDFDNEIT